MARRAPNRGTKRRSTEPQTPIFVSSLSSGGAGSGGDGSVEDAIDMPSIRMSREDDNGVHFITAVPNVVMDLRGTPAGGASRLPNVKIPSLCGPEQGTGALADDSSLSGLSPMSSIGVSPYGAANAHDRSARSVVQLIPSLSSWSIPGSSSANANSTANASDADEIMSDALAQAVDGPPLSRSSSLGMSEVARRGDANATFSSIHDLSVSLAKTSFVSSPFGSANPILRKQHASLRNLRRASAGNVPSMSSSARNRERPASLLHQRSFTRSKSPMSLSAVTEISVTPPALHSSFSVGATRSFSVSTGSSATSATPSLNFLRADSLPALGGSGSSPRGPPSPQVMHPLPPLRSKSQQGSSSRPLDMPDLWPSMWSGGEKRSASVPPEPQGERRGSFFKNMSVRKSDILLLRKSTPLTPMGKSGSDTDRLVLYMDPTCDPCRSVHFLAEEIGVEFFICPIWMARGDHRQAEFLKINPRHYVPALVHTTALGESLTLCESTAIMQYLCELKGAECYATYFGATPFERAKISELLTWHQTALRRTLNQQHGMPVYFQPYLLGTGIVARRTSLEESKSRAGYHEHILQLENLLDGKKYLVGDRLTAADAAIAPSVTTMHMHPHEERVLDGFPNVREWLDRLAGRPAFKIAHTAMDEATDEIQTHYDTKKETPGNFSYCITWTEAFADRIVQRSSS